MKMVKSLLLGTAAGLVAIAGAQAADLPVKAKAVEYVKVCSLYGAGFYYIPGTDTCIKVGGYVRGEVNYNANGTLNVGPTLAGTQSLNDRETRTLTWRSRIILSLDVRSQTEYGTLRSAGRFGGNWESSTAALATTFYWDSAFIQFAGFTAGSTLSFYDFVSYAAYSYQTNIIGSDIGPLSVPLFAYTMQFGNGLSATLSLEDGAKRRNALTDLSAGGAVFAASGAGPTSDYVGNRAPDIVANVRIDQAWGKAQLSGALHEVAGAYIGPNAAANGIALSPGDKWGWAAQAGLILNLPTAKGDTLALQASYSQGATYYAAGVGFNTAQWYSDNTHAAFGWITDGVFGGALGTGTELTTAWAIQAALEHYWQPNLRTSLYGGYLKIDYSDAAQAAIAATTGGPFSGAANANPDFAVWQIGSRTVWNPVANLDVGFDVLYTRINTAFAGTATFNTNGSRPSCGAQGLAAGCGTIEDQGILSAVFRVQRNFWP